MSARHRLLFGPLAIALLLFAILGLAQGVPGYSPLHQTVSEIGQMDSPERVPFALTGFAIAACVLVFASGLQCLRALPAGGLSGAACHGPGLEGRHACPGAGGLLHDHGHFMRLALLANPSTLDRGGMLWAYERPFYGLVQRSLVRPGGSGAPVLAWCCTDVAAHRPLPTSDASPLKGSCLGAAARQHSCRAPSASGPLRQPAA